MERGSFSPGLCPGVKLPIDFQFPIGALAPGSARGVAPPIDFQLLAAPTLGQRPGLNPQWPLNSAIFHRSFGIRNVLQCTFALAAVLFH